MASQGQTYPVHIASHNRPGIAPGYPVAVAVDIVLRFPQCSLKKRFQRHCSTKYRPRTYQRRRLKPGGERPHHVVPDVAQIRMKAYHNGPVFTNLTPKVIGAERAEEKMWLDDQRDQQKATYEQQQQVVSQREMRFVQTRLVALNLVAASIESHG